MLWPAMVARTGPDFRSVPPMGSVRVEPSSRATMMRPSQVCFEKRGLSPVLTGVS